MLFPNVKILECRRERLHDQFIARSEMLVEAPNRNTRFLHHIGDADTFKSLLAKPLGGLERFVGVARVRRIVDARVEVAEIAT